MLLPQSLDLEGVALHLSLPYLGNGKLCYLIHQVRALNMFKKEHLLAIPLFPQSLEFHTITSLMRSSKSA